MFEEFDPGLVLMAFYLLLKIIPKYDFPCMNPKLTFAETHRDIMRICGVDLYLGYDFILSR